MAKYKFVKFEQRTRKTGLLSKMEVGDVREATDRTELQVRMAISTYVKKHPEATFSWDPTANPIVVRRDT
jgi:hypothetical protein